MRADNRVAAPVYFAALAPDADETSQSQQQKFPVTDVFSHIEVADGRIWLKPDGIRCFARDLPEAEQKLVWATQAGPVPDLFTQKVDGVRYSMQFWGRQRESAGLITVRYCYARKTGFGR